jgi:hypothetical protein
MDDDASEMMNAQASPDPGLRGNRDASRDLRKAFDEEANRLHRDATLMEPAKDTVNYNGLKTLREYPSH